MGRCWMMQYWAQPRPRPWSCAICVLYVIFMWNEKPIWRWGSIIYAVLIFLGSLYSGWHYAIDGYAGALIAITVTWITAKLPQMQPF